MKLLYLVESGESKFLVFDEMPDKISTKYGDDTIIGRIGGIFYDFLAKRNERREKVPGRIRNGKQETKMSRGKRTPKKTQVRSIKITPSND